MGETVFWRRVLTRKRGKRYIEPVSENKVGSILATLRMFKFSGPIGEPGQTEKLFVSLMHQIDSGLKRDYQENEIVDAVIGVISPYSSLRGYVEL